MIFTEHRAVRIACVALAVTGALSIAGCGSKATTSSPSATHHTTTTTPPPTMTTPAAPGTNTVTVEVNDMKFSPAAVTIKTGDTVVWKFDDKVPHEVQGIGDSALGINSPIFNRGEWSHTFAIPGTYRYMCTLHPEMRGTVTVQ